MRKGQCGIHAPASSGRSREGHLLRRRMGRTLMKLLSVKNWEKFQHYKDRSPPWIKLHRELLTSEAWVLGNDSSRLLQVASMLLAARYENRIPYRFDLIRKVASLDLTERQFDQAVEHLSQYDFLEIQGVTSDPDVSVQDASTMLAKCSSEERRGEKRRDRGEAEKISVELKLDLGPVERIFDHWRREWGHQKAVLDPKRRRVIEAALKSFDETTLCASISGYRNSPHHTGENDRRTVYDDLGLFLRDATHVENGLRFARGPPQAAKSAVEMARENLRRSINGNGNGSVVAEQSGSGESGVGSLVGMLR